MNNILKNRFKNKVMIVTGGSRGIGKETAIRAAKEGANVVIVDLLDEGKKVCDEINSTGDKSIFIKANLAKENEVKSLVEKTVSEFGKVDILINNAGVTGVPNPIDEVSKDDFDFTFKTNLYSVFYCCKYAIKQFMKQKTGGIIINNSSTAGITGTPGLPAYNASKHAINGLTKNLAMDYAKYNIRINSINPFSTITPLLEKSIELYKKQSPDLSESFVGTKINSLLQRPSTAAEQVACILFLASDDATHMTGATVVTDGGFTAY